MDPNLTGGDESVQPSGAPDGDPELAAIVDPQPSPPSLDAGPERAPDETWPAVDIDAPRETSLDPVDEAPREGWGDDTAARDDLFRDAEHPGAQLAGQPFADEDLADSEAHARPIDDEDLVELAPDQDSRPLEGRDDEQPPRRGTRVFDGRRSRSTSDGALPGRKGAGRQRAAVLRADPEAICPFLVSASGSWRLAVPSREHRCGAVSPAAPLAPQKQARLCLTEGHLRCATYLAAGAAREARVGSAANPDRVSRWALARTIPVVEEVGGVRSTLAGLLGDRRRWPAIPAMLLVVALATLGLSSLRGEGPVSALVSPSPSESPVAVATPSTGPSPSAAATPEPSAAATAAPAPTPTPPPTPAASHGTYTVASGDTLYAIARQFGTTVSALSDLNGITDPSKLHVGQVLLIP